MLRTSILTPRTAGEASLWTGSDGKAFLWPTCKGSQTAEQYVQRTSMCSFLLPNVSSPRLLAHRDRLPKLANVFPCAVHNECADSPSCHGMVASIVASTVRLALAFLYMGLSSLQSGFQTHCRPGRGRHPFPVHRKERVSHLPGAGLGLQNCTPVCALRGLESNEEKEEEGSINKITSIDNKVFFNF